MAALQGVLGKVLEAEKKARDPDVSEDPLENRELPDDEIIEEEVTDPETAEDGKWEENGNKKKEQRGGKKKGKNKKGGKSVKNQQTKTKCLKQRQVKPINIYYHNQRIILDENLRPARTNGNDLRTTIVSEPRPGQH